MGEERFLFGCLNVLYLLILCTCICVSQNLGNRDKEDKSSEDEGNYFKENNDARVCKKNVNDAGCEGAHPSKMKCIWGYEEGCSKRDRKYSQADCSDMQDSRHFRSLEDRVNAFWEENDFGYIRTVQELKRICEPKDPEDSSFECNEQLTYCKGRDIFFDFSSSDRRSIHERARSKPFNRGQFGGSCKLHPEYFKNPRIYRGKLRSWAADDIDHFEELPFKPSNKKNCDVVVKTPTFIMDLDAVGNLYHHFCDFFNLYVTLHVNGSLHQSYDVAIWSSNENLMKGPFGVTWNAFTKNVYSLWAKYANKKVCFKDVVFALLPRMAYGMYYSTPVVPGCSKSGLFQAFSKYIIDGLNIGQNRKSVSKPLRITLLYRSTKYRRIVNKDELVSWMKSLSNVVLNVVDFNWDMPFIKQLKISHNSDIFIGMHGAGLAHALFLPNWAVLFELYNTGDINCYKDLARLRGVTYITWEKNDKLREETEDPSPDHQYDKFRNFRFDLPEFKRLVKIAIKHAKENIRSAKFT